ncbi:MAG TPA: GNAT family N-acetyltransferase [Mucilaginibacter sp.]|nr:GNAT family N-acetyltransferase [Mucilaginibacter sp.]
MDATPKTKSGQDVLIRPLEEGDLQAADHITRLAFGTFLGLPEPTTFMGDTKYVHTRWRANPDAAFCAEIDGELVGSNFVSDWGSVGFFGPLTTHPKMWDQGVAKLLIEPAIECFEGWGTRQAGLMTFAESIKHVNLYQKFGFYPRFLTAIMSKAVDAHADDKGVHWTKFSDVPVDKRTEMIETCRQLTDSVFEGLDLRREILSVASQYLGDTVLLWEGSNLAGLAICHCGAGSEAGSGICYIKFAAVSSGSGAAERYADIITACETLAAQKGLQKLTGGANTARQEAYDLMFGLGFKTNRQTVVMHRPNDSGYNRPGVFIIDDWR